MSITTRTVLTTVTLCLLSQATLALKPEREYPQKPSDWGLEYEDVSFTTQDNLTLVGWFIPGTVSADTLKRQTIICVNGDSGNMGYQGMYANLFVRAGFNVLLFDWRGFGESSKWEIDRDDLVYPEFILDLNAAIDYLKNRDDMVDSNIGLFGYSTGAYLIFGCAGSREDIAAIIVRGLITTIPDALRNLKTIAPDRELRLPHGYPESRYPINVAPNLFCPVFLIVGSLDRRSTPDMSRQVYDLLPGEKELWIVEGATHGYPKGPEFLKTEEFSRRVTAFFREHLIER